MFVFGRGHSQRQPTQTRAGGALRLVTPADDLAVTLDEVKAHLRIEHDDDDDTLSGFIATVSGDLEPPTGWLMRAFQPQQWAVDIDWHWPRQEIELPILPVISVDSVTYVDVNGATQTLATSEYDVFLGERGSIAPKFDKCWPQVRRQRAAITITFTAGYAQIPETQKTTLKMMVGELYENRESSTTLTLEAIPWVGRALNRLRVQRPIVQSST